MSTDTTLTSYILNPWTGTHHGGGTDLIALAYADLDFIPSANDPYKSTSGDVFKVYVNGIRIYRTDDQNYAGGDGFLEDTDSSGIELNDRPAVWTDTSNAVWTIDTATQKILLSKSAIAATTLYGSSGLAVDFTTSSTAPIIELRRAVQDLKTPAVDFSNASILTEQDLDNSAKNVFHVAQQAVISTENAMLFDSGTDTYKATQPGTPTPKRISNVATGTATTDAVNFGQFTSHDATIIGYRDTTEGYKEDAEDYKLEAGDWATKVNGVVNTYTDNVANSDGTEYSAKEYAIGTTVATGSSKDWATQDTTAIDGGLFSAKEYASGSSATGGTAKEWAQKNDGAVDTEFSAKAYASVTGSNAPTDGSAKEWATTTGGAVASSEYSAKEYAQGVTATGGTSKEWAQKNDGAVDTEFSAKAYASVTGTHAPTLGSAKEWATVTGAQIDSDYSAKEYAIGTTATSAKSYATTTGSAVTGSDYSAKEWALGDLTTTGGSAKAWAVDTSSPDGTTTKSAKTWAGEASASAASADSVSTSNAIVMGIALG